MWTTRKQNSGNKCEQQVVIGRQYKQKWLCNWLRKHYHQEIYSGQRSTGESAKHACEPRFFAREASARNDEMLEPRYASTPYSTDWYLVGLVGASLL